MIYTMWFVVSSVFYIIGWILWFVRETQFSFNAQVYIVKMCMWLNAQCSLTPCKTWACCFVIKKKKIARMVKKNNRQIQNTEFDGNVKWFEKMVIGSVKGYDSHKNNTMFGCCKWNNLRVNSTHPNDKWRGKKWMYKFKCTSAVLYNSFVNAFQSNWIQTLEMCTAKKY